MQLNSYKLNSSTLNSQNLDWSSVLRLEKAAPAVTSSIKLCKNQSQQEFKSDTWVKLLELPSNFSFDEALLLCEISEDEWVAWIPDHGEATLNVSQFCQII